MPNEINQPTKSYIVKNEQGEEFLLPNYSATFRILMDDKETIRDVLNSVLQLEHKREITDLNYEFDELPETVSVWLCNDPILDSKDIFKDTWSVYSEHEINMGKAHPLFPKNKYIIIDLLFKPWR